MSASDKPADPFSVAEPVSGSRAFPMSQQLDEEARLAELAAYQLEHAPTPVALQSIAAFAADVFQAPIALVSLVDRDWQFFCGQ